MSDAKKLQRKDIKNEVKRIKKLPPEQREEQFEALYKRVSDEIESTSKRIDIEQLSVGEKRKEARRLLYCVMAFTKDYRKSIYKKWKKTFTKAYGAELNLYYVNREVQRIRLLPKHEYESEMLRLTQEIEEHIDCEKTMKNFGGRATFYRFIESLPLEYEKTLKAKYWNAFYLNMVHVSGLPLPEHAEVKIALQEHQLSIISGPREFALPINRIINMGTTVDYGYYQTKEYLTIEYEKEGETKHIVAYSHLIGFAAKEFGADMVKYFRDIKKLDGVVIKQEL